MQTFVLYILEFSECYRFMLIHEEELFNNNSYLYLPHSSAGVGRTGTFLAIDTMMQRLKEKDDLNIYKFVTYMRTRRTFMVQNQVH